MSLEAGAKMALQKAMQAVKSGKLKPGDSMVVRGKDEEMLSSPHDMPDDGLEPVAQDLCSLLGVDPSKCDSLKELLMEFCEKCAAK